MDSPDLESLLNHFNDRITLIQDLIPLTRLVEEQIKRESSNIFYAPSGMTITAPVDTSVDGPRNSSDISFAQADVFSDLQSLANLVLEMQTMVKEVNENVESQKLSLDRQEERIKLRMGGLRAHLKYLQGNFQSRKRPAGSGDVVNVTNGYKRVDSESNGVINKQDEESTETVPIPIQTKGNKKLANATVTKTGTKNGSTCTKKSAPGDKTGTVTRKKNPSFNVPKVTELNQEEFDSIPGYQKGRLTLEVVNKSILDFNKAISSKYRLMSAPNRNTEAEIKRFQMYKSQENAETKGEYFVTSADLKELSDLKADNTTKLVLQCLRHCKRVKEIRGPVKVIRFAVCCKNN